MLPVVGAKHWQDCGRRLPSPTFDVFILLGVDVGAAMCAEESLRRGVWRCGVGCGGAVSGETGAAAGARLGWPAGRPQAHAQPAAALNGAGEPARVSRSPCCPSEPSARPMAAAGWPLRPPDDQGLLPHAQDCKSSTQPAALRVLAALLGHRASYHGHNVLRSVSEAAHCPPKCRRQAAAAPCGCRAERS